MSTLMQILNLYATRDSQTKFEGNRMKNGRVTVLKLVEEEEEEEERQERRGQDEGKQTSERYRHGKY